jgi:hypothetical protein
MAGGIMRNNCERNGGKTAGAELGSGQTTGGDLALGERPVEATDRAVPIARVPIALDTVIEARRVRVVVFRDGGRRGRRGVTVRKRQRRAKDDQRQQDGGQRTV